MRFLRRLLAAKIVRGALAFSLVAVSTAATFGNELIVGTYYYGPTPNTVLSFTTNGGAAGAIGGGIAYGSGGVTASTGVAVGPDGNLYVSSNSASNIVEFNGQTGAYVGVYATLTDPGAAPAGLTFGTDGNLYVANYSYGGQVEEFSGPNNANPGTPVLTAASGYTNNDVTTTLAEASGLTVDSNTGAMYISDIGSDNIVALNSPYSFNLGASPLQTPGGLTLVPDPSAVGGEALLVADVFGNQILAFDLTGAYLGVFATIPPTPDGSPLPPPVTVPYYTSNFPSDLVYDPVSNSVYVAVLGKDFDYSGSLLGYPLQYDVNGNPVGGTVTTLASGLPGAAITLSPVPEPSSIVLACLGGIGFWIAWRRRKVRTA